MHIDRLVQERRNWSTLAMELQIFLINPSILEMSRGYIDLSQYLHMACTYGSHWNVNP